MVDCLLGIDAGSTMTKAVLFGLDGTELACERRQNPIQFPTPGHTERDADRMWSDAADAIRHLADKARDRGWTIVGVAPTGYGAGLYLIDAAGDPVRPAIMSTDSRALGLIARWQRDELAERGGRRIHQRLWPGQSAVLLAWLVEHEPDVIARTRSILFCKDFIRARLCGDISTDATDAGIAGLLDLRQTAYATELFGELGMKAWLGKLPPVGSATQVAGKITAAAARATGLKEGTPVVRGVVDVTASAIASGVATPQQLSVVAGTFSINSTLHAAPRVSHLPFLQCAYPIGDYYLATEGSATSASNLEWFCKSILSGDTARAAELGRPIYEICNELVAGALDRPNDILFLPFVFGGPGGAPAGLIGLLASHDLADVVRAIYECIAFAHKHDIEGLLVGADAARPTSIRLAGGASRSDVWAQIFADVLNLPVEVAGGSELGALGAAMCAATALGGFDDLAAAAQGMSRVARHYTPDAARVKSLACKRARYSALVSSLGNAGAQPLS